ncbi:MAG: hypothetical protein ACYTGL_16265 [Planctomycetota bacterium]|jgi:hypothetical protein
MNEDAHLVILDRDDAAFDSRLAAETIASAVDLVVAEVQQWLAISPGFMTGKLSEYDADRVAAALNYRGVPAIVIPIAEVIELPDVIEVVRGQVLDDGFAAISRRETTVVKWGDILWMELPEVQSARTVEQEDMVFSDDEDGGTEVVKVRRHVTEWHVHLDLVCYDPWCLLRIRPDQFAFAATGLKVHPSRHQNLNALCIALATRATHATFGPGMKWFENAAPMEPVRVPDMQTYQKRLSWNLTRLFWHDAQTDAE